MREDEGGGNLSEIKKKLYKNITTLSDSLQSLFPWGKREGVIVQPKDFYFNVNFGFFCIIISLQFLYALQKGGVRGSSSFIV